LQNEKDKFERNNRNLSTDLDPISGPFTRAAHWGAKKLGFAQRPQEELFKSAQRQLDQANGSFLIDDARVAGLRLKQAVGNYNTYAGMVKAYFEAVGAGAETGKTITEFAIAVLSAVFTGGATVAAGGGLAAGAAISGATSAGTTLAQQQGEEWFGVRHQLDLTTIVGNGVAGAAGSLIGGSLSKYFLPRLTSAKEFEKVWKWKEAGCPGDFEGWVLRGPLPHPHVLLPVDHSLVRAPKILNVFEKQRLLADYLLRQGGRWVEDAIKQVVAGHADQTMTVETFTKGVAAQVTKSSVQKNFAKWLAGTLVRR
jgi:hypothetical protein